eukprot:TRINITY_DN12081_c0_g1_i2.p1 TRINITY_DN12081_c0_g1~~TRINITY_DN12081_c0_g1_i2.p1  ORF type:complete len:274 (-),score=8.83 TRINITY_DN12081_c0_g1_i2:191-901(-)
MGLVHRDIKPSNILWRETTQKCWTLIDFGCVVSIRQETQALLAYSLPYAAPEVIHALERNESVMSIHTSLDIWSMGIVMWELLTESRLFPFSMDAAAIQDQLAGRTPLPWEDTANAANRAKVSQLGFLKRIVLSCLSREASERPSAHELHQNLNAIFAHATTTTSQTPVWTPRSMTVKRCPLRALVSGQRLQWIHAGLVDCKQGLVQFVPLAWAGTTCSVLLVAYCASITQSCTRS